MFIDNNKQTCSTYFGRRSIIKWGKNHYMSMDMPMIVNLVILLANIGKSKLLSSIDHHNGDFNCMI
jgi:hypothetical protein